MLFLVLAWIPRTTESAAVKFGFENVEDGRARMGRTAKKKLNKKRHGKAECLYRVSLLFVYTVWDKSRRFHV